MFGKYYKYKFDFNNLISDLLVRLVTVTLVTASKSPITPLIEIYVKNIKNLIAYNLYS